MFTTSADILNLVLTVCIIALTFFLCFAIYHLASSARRINRIAKIIETGALKVEEVVNLAKAKLKNSSAYFMILAEVAKKAMEFIQEKRTEKKAGAGTSKSKKK